MARSGALPGTLLWSASNGDETAIKQWLGKGGHVDSTHNFPVKSPTEEVPRGISLLMIASFHGHEKTVKLLLDRKASIDLLQDNLGTRALTYAATCTAPASAVCVKMLLDARGDPTKCNFEGITPLKRAEDRGNAEVAKILWQALEEQKAQRF